MMKPAAPPFTTDPCRACAGVSAGISVTDVVDITVVLTVDMLTGCGMLTWAVPGPDCLLCSCVHLSWDTH